VGTLLFYGALLLSPGSRASGPKRLLWTTAAAGSAIAAHPGVLKPRLAAVAAPRACANTPLTPLGRIRIFACRLMAPLHFEQNALILSVGVPAADFAGPELTKLLKLERF
jgi:hypothetical protein